MADQVRWVRHKMNCPEGKGESELFIEWKGSGSSEVINSISCANPLLKDLSGGDCQWTCWEEITKRKI